MIRSGHIMLILNLGLPFWTILQYHLTEGTACLTPDQKRGNCINIRKCDAAVQILQGPKPLSTESANYLRDSHCGYEGDSPKVCCETMETTTVDWLETTEDPLANFPTPPLVSNHRNLHLINKEQCGMITERKILGGSKAGLFEYPWMAMVAYNNSNVIEFRCAGTIISKRYILTAAHCVTILPEPLILKGVRVGDHDISTEQDCEENNNSEVVCAERYQDFGIESTIYHPDFMTPRWQNDIGLIRVDDDIDFRPRNVRPICLPINQQLPSMIKKVIVTGWGQTESGASSNYMVKVQLPIVDNKRCLEVYKRKAPIGHEQMCAGGADRKDSCIGDSGGPLQIPGLINGTIKYIQHGIVSFGLQTCGIEGYPGVYIRVVYYMDWILDNISE